MPCTELCVPQIASLPHPPPRATYASAVVTHHDLVSPRVRHLGCAQPLNVYQRTITIQGKMTVSLNTHAQLFHVELWVETECLIRSRWDKEAPVFMKISSLDFFFISLFHSPLPPLLHPLSSLTFPATGSQWWVCEAASSTVRAGGAASCRWLCPGGAGRDCCAGCSVRSCRGEGESGAV